MDGAELHCRVCGLRHDDPPWGPDGRTPSYFHCACCGVEFGYGDATPIGARRHRAQWLAGGAQWDTPSSRPENWTPDEQLTHVPAAFR